MEYRIEIKVRADSDEQAQAFADHIQSDTVAIESCGVYNVSAPDSAGYEVA